MSCTRSELVKQLQAWLGLKEADGSFKKIIDLYNTIKPLPVGYKLKYTDAWCAGTVSAAAQACNATDIIPTECSCPRMIEKAKSMGIWMENDAYTPQPGDILLYDWEDSGAGDNTGSPNHVGVVEKLSGSTITVIEGNYSNAVKRRTLQVNGRYIRGYITPQYREEAGEENQADFQLGLRELETGSRGEDVRALQLLLNGRGHSCGNADGEFGKKTDAAVRGFQQAKQLTADGIAGPKTWSALLGL